MNLLTRMLFCCNGGYQNLITTEPETSSAGTARTLSPPTRLEIDHRTTELSCSVLSRTASSSSSSFSSSSSSSSRIISPIIPSVIFYNVGSYLSRGDLLSAQAVNNQFADHWNYSRSAQTHPNFHFEIAIRSFAELQWFLNLPKENPDNIFALALHLIHKCKADSSPYRIKLEWCLWKLRTFPNQDVSAVDSLLALIDTKMDEARISHRLDLKPYYAAFRNNTLDRVSLETFPLDRAAMVILIDLIKSEQEERTLEGLKKLKQLCLKSENVDCLCLLHELNSNLLERLLIELFEEDPSDEWLKKCCLNKDDLIVIISVLKKAKEEGYTKLKQLCLKLRNSELLPLFYDQLGLNFLERLLSDLSRSSSLSFDEWFKFLRPNLPIMVLGHCNAAKENDTTSDLVRLRANLERTMKACPNATILILDTDKCPEVILEYFCARSFANKIKSFKITNIDLKLGQLPLDFISQLEKLEKLEDVEISGSLSPRDRVFLDTIETEACCSSIKIVLKRIKLVEFTQLTSVADRRVGRDVTNKLDELEPEKIEVDDLDHSPLFIKILYNKYLDTLGV